MPVNQLVTQCVSHEMPQNNRFIHANWPSRVKAQKQERVTQFAPIAHAITQRALHLIEGTAGIVHERKKDTAVAYGFAFHLSHTLKCLGIASAPLRDIVRITRSSPDLLDTGLIERLTEGFGPV